MRRTSYQKGSLRLADRKKGKVWEFLWREVQLDGAIRRKHIVIGTQEDLPTESVAQAAVDAIRLEINQQTPQRLIKSISFETLVNHYRQHQRWRYRSGLHKSISLLASPTGFEPVLPP